MALKFVEIPEKPGEFEVFEGNSGEEEPIGNLHSKIAKLICDVLEINPQELTNAKLYKLLNAKYLVVIDMGCGNTSASFVDLKNFSSNPDGSVRTVTWAYNDLQLDYSGKPEFVAVNDRPSVPTLIGTDVINWAIGPEALTLATSSENFKNCPYEVALNEQICRIDDDFHDKHIGFTLKDVWKQYLGIILSKICSWGVNHAEVADANDFWDNTIIMLAHPAGMDWSEKDILNSYRSLIKLPNLSDDSVITVSEATAAMQYIKRKKNISFKNGVLLIDIGASTIDIEYIDLNGVLRPKEYSLTMAGRDVDKLIAHYLFEKWFPADMHGTACNYVPSGDTYIRLVDPNGSGRYIPYSEFMLLVRACKEDICNDILAERPIDIPAPCPRTDNSLEFISVSSDVLLQLMGYPNQNHLTISQTPIFPAYYDLPSALYLGKDSGIRNGFQQIEATWKGHFENLLKYVLSNVGIPDYVVITGGSCRLPNIENTVKEIISEKIASEKITSEKKDAQFPSDHVICLKEETDYEEAVPFGGAYFVGSLVSNLEDVIKFPYNLSQNTGNLVAVPLTTKIINRIDTSVQTLLQKSFDWWAEIFRDYTQQNTINDLKKDTKNRISNRFGKSTDGEQNRKTIFISAKNELIGDANSTYNTAYKKWLNDFIGKISGRADFDCSETLESVTFDQCSFKFNPDNLNPIDNLGWWRQIKVNKYNNNDAVKQRQRKKCADNIKKQTYHSSGVDRQKILNDILNYFVSDPNGFTKLMIDKITDSLASEMYLR